MKPEDNARNTNQSELSQSLQRKHISFDNNILLVNEAHNDSKHISSFYKQLINAAKRTKDIPGALYIASETLPLDTVNSNFKRIPSKSKTLRAFVKSFSEPYPIPVVYNHVTSKGGFFSGNGDQPSRVAGRVYVARTHTLRDDGGRKAIYTGQAITDDETIERIHNAQDLTRSVSFMPAGFKCSTCGKHPFLDDCPHRSGEYVEKDEKRTNERVVFDVDPDFAVEDSFVLVPAFRTTMIKAIEQNNDASTVEMNIPSLGLISYTKKIMSNGFTAEGDKERNNDTIDNNNAPSDTTDGENTEENTGGSNEMDPKELKEALENLTNSVSSLTKDVAELKKDSQNDTSSAPTNTGDTSTDGAGNNSENNNNDTGDTRDQSFIDANATIDIFSAALISITNSIGELIKSTAELVAKTNERIDAIQLNTENTSNTEQTQGDTSDAGTQDNATDSNNKQEGSTDENSSTEGNSANNDQTNPANNDKNGQKDQSVKLAGPSLV